MNFRQKKSSNLASSFLWDISFSVWKTRAATSVHREHGIQRLKNQLWAWINTVLCTREQGTLGRQCNRRGAYVVQWDSLRKRWRGQYNRGGGSQTWLHQVAIVLQDWPAPWTRPPPQIYGMPWNLVCPPPQWILFPMIHWRCKEDRTTTFLLCGLGERVQVFYWYAAFDRVMDPEEIVESGSPSTKHLWWTIRGRNSVLGWGHPRGNSILGLSSPLEGVAES